MDFADKIKQFGKRANELKDCLQTEEATKTSLIMPFFSLLGYDVFNPEEFVPEFTADVGIKKGEKCDYAILNDGKPVILIEAKWVKEPLEKHISQLFRYFVATEAKFAILTNGVVYRFYTDLNETNKMDEKPFLEFNLLDIKEPQITELKKFRKSDFNTDEIFNTASQLKYSSEVRKILENDLHNPSDELVKYFLSSIYSGQITQQLIEKFRPIIKLSLNQFLNEIMNDNVKTALNNDSPEENENDRSGKSFFYVLNTNLRSDKKYDEEMLNEHKAAAYTLPYGKNIMKLKRGDVVFLYRNESGIVAYGTADGDVKTKPFIRDGVSETEYYMHLDNFKKLKNPLTAVQMKKLSNNLAFQKTMYKIDDESGISFIDEINKHYL